jgi:hypothetical protein
MAIKMVKFSEVPTGFRFFLQDGKDWDCHRKVSASLAQRETALLGVAIGQPFEIKLDAKVKIVD